MSVNLEKAAEKSPHFQPYSASFPFLPHRSVTAEAKFEVSVGVVINGQKRPQRSKPLPAIEKGSMLKMQTPLRLSA